MITNSARKRLERIIDFALEEDVGRGDVTTNILIPKTAKARARIVTHETATMAGLEVAKQVFKRLDKHVRVRPFFKDGDIVRSGKRIIEIQGNARALLTAERVALNFLSHLSAIATNTTAFVKNVQPTKVEIVDTRKTTPGLRLFEKKAIRCAKGINHRFNLNEMVLIKDNHHLLSHLSITDMIAKAKHETRKLIGVEVENFEDFKEAWAARPHLILLDNMTIPEIKRAVDFSKKDRSSQKPVLEVSGGVTLKNIRSIMKTGIRRMSIGALTHTKKTINISMEIVI
ncbi:MAG: carboxylating nicotinate-nucleotide diphosphorylase [Candidatus Omnitrophica bacterium]|nr:carboxylating nicotinate-nucleotide diphosphorylase [Candidatus Omnitrophota bacterium]